MTSVLGEGDREKSIWSMISAYSKHVLKMVENFLSLFDFQGGSFVLEKDEKKESDMMSNIFDYVNLGNIVYEPGSHLTIFDATATWITTNLWFWILGE